jgi:hypothetical protein
MAVPQTLHLIPTPVTPAGTPGRTRNARPPGHDRGGRSGVVVRWFRLRSDGVSPGDHQSSRRAIENLIASYAELVDDGGFAAVGLLLAAANFTGGSGTVSGREAIAKTLRENVIVLEDSTPCTKHIITNLAIEVDEKSGTATSRSYFTALQALPDLVRSRSSAAGTTTASNAAMGTGVSWRRASEPISSVT